MDGAFDVIDEVFDSYAHLARLLGCHKMTISQWKSRGKIPAERVPEIVAAADGLIEPHQLRPDLYPEPSVAA